MGYVSVKKIADADFPTRWGQFRILGFEGELAEPRECDQKWRTEARKLRG